MLIRPSELRYTHDSIANHFRNGKTLEDSLWKLLRKLNEVDLRIAIIPKMEVMEHNGHYYAVGGNRRLYLFQKLELAGIITEVNVVLLSFNQSRFDKQHTTLCEGQFIGVRHSPNMDGKLSHIIAKYQQKKIGFPVSDDDSDDSFLYDSDDFGSHYGWGDDDRDHDFFGEYDSD